MCQQVAGARCRADRSCGVQREAEITQRRHVQPGLRGERQAEGREADAFIGRNIPRAKKQLAGLLSGWRNDCISLHIWVGWSIVGTGVYFSSIAKPLVSKFLFR